MLQQKFYVIWKYRYLIKELTIKELKLRYKRSVLGFFWSFLNPLFMMLVYWFVFGRLFHRMPMENYPIYLLSGLLVWNFFSISLTNTTHSLLHNAALIKKIYFPREAFPLATVCSCMINLILSFVPFFIILIFSHRIAFSPALLMLPLGLILLFIMTVGICLFLSVISVFFRDFVQIIEFLLLAWFFLSPIIYHESLLLEGYPQIFQQIYQLNPLYPLIKIFQFIFYEGQFPPLNFFIYALVLCYLVLVGGMYYFHKNENSVVKLL